MPHRFLLNLALVLALFVTLAPVLAAQSDVRDLTQLSLDDLSNILVTSVAKREQNLSRVPASVFVITQDDIRRSGMSNIPDLLRMVPGVNVARLDANAWAISIRGFNALYADKVLVLIDGRSLYNPVFSNVYWDQVDLPLEDIERIEVIRGPGGTVWGANAMNGVINIITRHTRDTQGGLFTARTGSEESLGSTLRYGGALGRKGTYRAYGKYSNTEASHQLNGAEAADGWHSTHLGFRTDWTLSPNDTATVEGDVFKSAEGQTISEVLPDRVFPMAVFNDRVRITSASLMGNWSHKFDNGSETFLQAYYDRANRYDQGRNQLDKLDFEFRYRFSLGSRNDLTAGAGYRLYNQEIFPAFRVHFPSPQQQLTLYNAYLQDEIRLGRSVSLTLGTKLEHNGLTQFEYEPSAQLTWTPNAHRTFWASAARAIRQPALFYEGSIADLSTLRLPDGTIGLLRFQGDPDAEPENVHDYEVGYRTQIGEKIAFDVTGSLSYYQQLQTAQSLTPYFEAAPGPPHLVLPTILTNAARSRNIGLEFSATWNVSKRIRLAPGLSLLKAKPDLTGAPPGTTAIALPGRSPSIQAQLRSSINLTPRLEWDTSAYFTGALQTPAVPAYTRLDTQIQWRWREGVTLGAGGQNLLAQHHLEFLQGYQVQPTLVERSFVGKITWRF